METKDRNRILNKSRQIGCSDSFACQHLLDALFNDTTELIVSPSQKQSNRDMMYIYDYLDILKDDFTIKTVKESESLLSFEEGGMIYSLPNSPSTVRGICAQHITLDEYAHFLNGTDKEMKEAIIPSTSRGGYITYNSTPFGNQNEYSNKWHEDNNLMKILLNWRQCPDFKKEKIEEIRFEIGEDAFLQEYENQFLSDAQDQEYPFQLITSCINHELEYKELDTTTEYLGGADIGRVNDLTAFYALQRTEKKLRGITKKTMKNTSYDTQKNYFNHLLNTYHFVKFRIDESGIGNNLAEDLHRGHPGVERVTFNNEIKQELVGNLKRLMQEGRIEYPNDPQLIESIRSIRRIYTPSNYIKFESIRNDEIGHADLFWALALAVKDESHGKHFVLPSSCDFKKDLNTGNYR